MTTHHEPSGTLKRLDAEHLQRLFDRSASGMMVTDAANRMIMVNGALCDLTGYAQADLLGQDPRILKSLRHDGPFFQTMWKTIAATGSWHGEIWNRRKNGRVLPYWLTVTTVTDDHGAVVNHVGVLTPISGMPDADAYIDRLRHYDTLTDLPNRLLFHDRLEHALLGAKRVGECVLVLNMDLDNFKLVNESMGHTAGDELLKQTAKRLNGCVRKGETFARTGGDEFALILTDIRDTTQAAKGGAAAAQRLIGALVKPIPIDGSDFFVTISIGISVFPDDAQTGNDLVRNAEAAMYHAKGHGRANYQFYAAHMNDKVKERVTIINKLHRSLDDREFSLNFQPQVSIGSGMVTGLEALLRWNTSDLGQVSPVHFIPLLEETRLILPVGRWVLQRALEQYGEFKAAGIAPERMGVNISALQFEERDLAKLVADTISRAGVDPKALELEITEGTIMSHSDATLKTLHALKEIGVSISIDDFGTGYSSINYLKRFPIDRLKVDRSFIMDIPGDKDDVAITGAVIAMAHSLGLTVIAEGVETVDQLDFLRRIGCEEVQGYYYSKPLAPDVCIEFLRKMQK